MSIPFYVVRVKGETIQLTKKEAEEVYRELREAFHTPDAVQHEYFGIPAGKNPSDITYRKQTC